MTTTPPEMQTVNRCQKKFEEWLDTRAISTAKGKDAWGREQYAHSHVEAMWGGWQEAWHLPSATPFPVETCIAEMEALKYGNTGSFRHSGHDKAVTQAIAILRRHAEQAAQPDLSAVQRRDLEEMSTPMFILALKCTVNPMDEGLMRNLCLEAAKRLERAAKDQPLTNPKGSNSTGLEMAAQPESVNAEDAKRIRELETFIEQIYTALRAKSISDLDTNCRMANEILPDIVAFSNYKDAVEISASYRKIRISDIIHAARELSHLHHSITRACSARGTKREGSSVVERVSGAPEHEVAGSSPALSTSHASDAPLSALENTLRQHGISDEFIRLYKNAASIGDARDTDLYTKESERERADYWKGQAFEHMATIDKLQAKIDQDTILRIHGGSDAPVTGTYRFGDPAPRGLAYLKQREIPVVDETPIREALISVMDCWIDRVSDDSYDDAATEFLEAIRPYLRTQPPAMPQAGGEVVALKDTDEYVAEGK